MKIVLKAYHGDNYPGDVIEVDDEEAARLIGHDAAAPAPEPVEDDKPAEGKKAKK